ncbi:helix-turn-helix transcriptional regulator [Mucilaginibacter rubeus]|uniref:Helix-turn-helix transcriptional regulator n=1 Tax=Mucilaginibacter rubeus TaxID=2027860 RepID=A0AAE6MM10_9SPHI|nr:MULTISPECIES: helix-turn-helix transcriptional regulator [Mucilaginibacter]QEM07807.1 helix-turn-helix transcriptional regulator [Mucilaginibacter rubeus]QEM20259.1 helix-turn-helix transcriptional regulator [Mucilaginibacter gossypii]QTE43023.1 helix-turn-helix transcriptional regulator [Mucilaginibacter rubeus]QTE49624.1 helix-turn-helix transcriptional regulator [Mucilaginibacter rubeus]QTE54719.1 helix-turn-helix transcriptional regulator [Mucilaginibacter rubeus]
MANTNRGKKENDPNTDDDYFFQLIGAYLKFLRNKAGFPNPEIFANIIGMSRSQYSAYEAGKNLNLVTFKKILLQFNIKVETWLNLDIVEQQEGSNMIITKMRQGRIDQVIEEVKNIDGPLVANKIGTKEAQRYIDILIYCTTAKSRSEILVNLLKMDDSTNTLKRVAGKLLDYKWLELTNKTKKNSPQQRYVITKAGKNLLKL